ANSGINVRDPLPGNKMTQAKLNPVSVAAEQYYPLPNQPGAPFTHINNFLQQAANAGRQERTEFKIDHAFNDAQRMFVRYSLLDGTTNPPNYWANIANPTAAPNKSRAQNAALDYTQMLGSSTVLNVRYGFSRASSVSDP